MPEMATRKGEPRLLLGLKKRLLFPTTQGLSLPLGAFASRHPGGPNEELSLSGGWPPKWAQPGFCPCKPPLMIGAFLYWVIVKQTDVCFARLSGTPRLRGKSPLLSVVATPKTPPSLLGFLARRASFCCSLGGCGRSAAGLSGREQPGRKERELWEETMVGDRSPNRSIPPRDLSHRSRPTGASPWFPRGSLGSAQNDEATFIT